jgi:hypothetical protein
MIKEIGLFATPKSWDELQAWIEGHSPEERAHLYTAACMAWNLASSIMNEKDK